MIVNELKAIRVLAIEGLSEPDLIMKDRFLVQIESIVSSLLDHAREGKWKEMNGKG